MTRFSALIATLVLAGALAWGCDGDESTTQGTGGTGGSGGSGGTGGSGGLGGSGAWEDPPTTSVSLSASDVIVLNPERGFYRTLSLVGDQDYQWVRQAGSTLAHSYLRLDDYRDSALDAAILDAFAQGLAEARQAGIKIVLRFAYNFGPYPNSEPDASKSRILEHISQLAPVVQANADVIAVLQAGFIGAWGEWHTSTHGLLDNPQDKFEILEATLQALPGDRMVQLRYPPHKEEGYGAALTDLAAYDGSSAARVGHHNDCFLASDNDWGTYPSSEVEIWKSYLEQDTAYVVMGGETCNLNPPRSDCPIALAEMERFHYTYINNEYHPDVVSSWSDQGCRDEMERRLGYRLTVQSVSYPETVRPGGVVPLTVALSNDGWAAPVNPRPLWVVLSDGNSRYEVVLPDVDPRWWLGGEEVEITVRLQLPGDAAAGAYDLALWLPDAAASLRDDSRYAIALANDDLWDEVSGLNRLVSIDVDPEAPGSSDPDATAFEVLP